MGGANNLALLQERQAKRAKLKESNADAYIQQDADMQGDNVISSSSEVQPLLSCMQCTLQPSQRDESCQPYMPRYCSTSWALSMLFWCLDPLALSAC